MILNGMRSKVNFGYKVYADIGASNPKGTIKLAIKSDDGEQTIYSSCKKSDIICPKGIINNEDFVKGIGRIISEKIKDCNKILGSLKDKDQFLSGLLLLVPGTVLKGNRLAYLSHIQYKDKTDPDGEYGLKDIAFNETTMQASEDFNDITKNTDNFKIVAVSDMMGSAVSAAKYLAQNKPEFFKTGSRLSIVMAGGGLGVAAIRVNEKNVDIENMQLGSMPIAHSLFAEKANQNITYHDGASAGGIITNYLKAMGLDKQHKDLVNLGDATIVTKYRDNIGIKEDEHNEASRRAIEEFAVALGQLCAYEAAYQKQAVFLAGPLINGLDEYLKKSSKGKETLTGMIEEKAKLYASPSVKKLMEARSFSINLIDEKEINSNIKDAELLLHKDTKLVDDEVYSWISIPKDAFEKKSL